jgi:hypothetical protein
LSVEGMAQKTEMRGEPMPELVTLPIGTACPSVQQPTGDDIATNSLCPPALALRELRHPAATGYRYRDIQNTDRING